MIVVKEAFRVSSPAARGRVAPVSATRMQQTTGASTVREKANMPQPSWQRRSYADILRGEGGVDAGTTPLHLHVEEERTQWLYCSIIGALKEENDVNSFQEKFLKSGPLPFQLTDCGGRLLILTFTDKHTKECALAGSMALQPWFRWLKPWSNECQPGVIRDAWIKCTGLPHQLWNQENLTRVGKIWGEVLPGNHVLRMMAMAFGWAKVRTSALQPISQDVMLLNNGVSCRVYVNEETFFNPEQWALGCMSGAQQVIFSGDRKQPGMVEQGFSSQRSFVSESRMSDGQREDAGIEADSGSPVAAETGSKVLDTCHAGMTDERIIEGGFSDLPGGGSVTREIVPFVSSVSHFQENCQLVVDLGRAFGPIPVLENSTAQRNLFGAMPGEVVGQEAQAGMASNFCPRFQNHPARSTTASQEKITRLGRQGRWLGKSLSDPSMAATGVRPAGGATLKMKRKGVLVRAAAEALAGSHLNRLSQRDTDLLEEASSTWELGKTLGLVADASDGEVIQRIMQLELRDAPGKERRDQNASIADYFPLSTGSSIWRVAFRIPLRAWQEELFEALLDQLHSAVHSLQDSHDRIVWAAEPHGVFSVRSLYRHLALSLGAEDPCLSVIWSSLASPRARLRFEGIMPEWDRISENIFFIMASAFSSSAVGRTFSITDIIHKMRDLLHGGC
ncbi:hypothetical protein Dimus_019063 [Dionaea muscipula]